VEEVKHSRRLATLTLMSPVWRKCPLMGSPSVLGPGLSRLSIEVHELVVIIHADPSFQLSDIFHHAIGRPRIVSLASVVAVMMLDIGVESLGVALGGDAGDERRGFRVESRHGRLLHGTSGARTPFCLGGVCASFIGGSNRLERNNLPVLRNLLLTPRACCGALDHCGAD
jgi:hypothetical protein